MRAGARAPGAATAARATQRWLVIVAIAVAVIVGAFAVTALLGALGAGGTIARVLTAAVIVLVVARPSGNRRLAVVGVALVGLSAVSGVAIDAVFGLFGPEPWNRGSLGPIDISSPGKWFTLGAQVKMVAWSSLLGAGVALLLVARWSRGRVASGSEAERGGRANG